MNAKNEQTKQSPGSERRTATVLLAAIMVAMLPLAGITLAVAGEEPAGQSISNCPNDLELGEDEVPSMDFQCRVWHGIDRMFEGITHAPSGTEAEVRVTGNVSTNAHGFDGTVGYAPAYSGAMGSDPCQSGAIEDSCADLEPAEAAAASALVEAVRDASVGWFNGSVTWETTYWESIGSAIDDLEVRFRPGVGWFLNLERTPLQAIPLYGGAHAELKDLWNPAPGESLRLWFECDGIPLNEVETADLLRYGPPGSIGIQSASLGSGNQGDFKESNNPGNDQGVFRIDLLTLGGIQFLNTAECGMYRMHMDWSLLFVFEAFAMTPDAVRQDIDTNDPSGYVSAVVAELQASNQAFSIGRYQQEIDWFHWSPATDDGSGEKFDWESAEDGEDYGFETRVFYAPVYPVRWACGWFLEDSGAPVPCQDVEDLVWGAVGDPLGTAAALVEGDTGHSFSIASGFINPVLGQPLVVQFPGLDADGQGLAEGPPTMYFNDHTFLNFGSGSGWSMSGLWHRTDACTDPATPLNGKYLGYHNGACTYETWDGYGNPSANSGSATRTFNLEDVEDAVLTFLHAFEVEPYGGSMYDVMTVRVRAADSSLLLQLSSWETISQWPQSGESTTNGWRAEALDISQFAGKKHVQVRFHFDTGDELHNQYAGWYIDHLMIVEAMDDGASGGGGGSSPPLRSQAISMY